MKIIFQIIIGALLLSACVGNNNSNEVKFEDSGSLVSSPNFTADREMKIYFEDEVNGVQVHIKSTVIKILPDDTDGSRHQKFIVELNSGQSILIAHNIDIAPRIVNISEGEQIFINGQYEWNAKGGVIHWTHHDPERRHKGGWIEYQGEFFE